MPTPTPALFRFASDLSPRPPYSGLFFSYYGGNVLTSLGVVNVPEDALLLPDNTTSYIECDDAGIVSSNLVGFTPGDIAMAKVTTRAGFVRTITDRRVYELISNTFVPGAGGGGGSVSRYTHTQAVASASWTVTHNLNAYVQVVIVDSADDEMEGDVTYPSLNQVQIDFSEPLTGKVHVI